MHISLVHELSNLDVLPLDLISFAKNIRKIMEEIDRGSDQRFDFTTIYEMIDLLAEQVRALLNKEIVKVKDYNRLVKTVGGTLNRLMFSYSSKYEFDNTFPFQPFPGLAKVKNIFSSNVSSEEFLFTLTYFVRQRNRFENEIKELCLKIDDYIKSFS
jgi:aminopeptidase YwaD